MTEQLSLKLRSIDFTTLRFEPTPDISTYELALVLQVWLNYGGLHSTSEAFYSLPIEVRRHFTYQLYEV
jgi:hypothetical protein